MFKNIGESVYSLLHCLCIYDFMNQSQIFVVMLLTHGLLSWSINLFTFQKYINIVFYGIALFSWLVNMFLGHVACTHAYLPCVHVLVMKCIDSLYAYIPCVSIDKWYKCFRDTSLWLDNFTFLIKYLMRKI